LYAPDAALSGTMALFHDETATNGEYFSIPEGRGKNDSLPPQATATFHFQLPVSGSYFVWVRVRSPSMDHQRFFINPGTGNWTTWKAGVHLSWSWVKIVDPASGHPVLYALNRGYNTFEMGWSDDHVQVDRILITNDLTFDPSLTEPLRESAMVVYPNPATGQLLIEYYSDLAQQAEVYINDLNAKLIQQSWVAVSIGKNKLPVDIHNLSNGIYVVSFLINGQKHSARLSILR
jgi:hypothetical protein